MKLIMCSVFDHASQAYGRPMFVPAVGVAIRSFSDECNNSQGDAELFRHASDYDLFELGVYDDFTASFDVLKEPRLLSRGKEVKLPPADVPSVRLAK